MKYEYNEPHEQAGNNPTASLNNHTLSNHNTATNIKTLPAIEEDDIFVTQEGQQRSGQNVASEYKKTLQDDLSLFVKKDVVYNLDEDTKDLVMLAFSNPSKSVKAEKMLCLIHGEEGLGEHANPGGIGVNIDNDEESLNSRN